MPTSTPFPDPISVLIPAFNEAGGILQQIEMIQHTLDEAQIKAEILVVDDGSDDATSKQAILAKSNVRLFRHPQNRGYGAALKTGIEAAEHEIIVIIDADGTYPSDQIPVLVDKLAQADMVVGARTGETVHQSSLRQPAKWLLRRLAIWIAAQPIPDLNSGLRAFRKETAKQYFGILSNRFSFTTTITLAYLVDDYRVVYHPINYYARVGKSKIAPWHFMDFLILILRISMMFNPLKIFIPLALCFGLLGAAKTAYDILAVFIRNPGLGLGVLLQPALSTSAVFLMFVGLQLLMIGMMADGVIRRIAQHSRPNIPSRGSISYEVHSSTGDKLD